MKIPDAKEGGGYARLRFYEDVIQKCFQSRQQRIDQYSTLKYFYLYGCSPNDDGSTYNKIEPVVDTLTAFLYSADSTRFSTHFPPETPPDEWAKAQPISHAVNAEWQNSGADQIFGRALEWACVYNSKFVKLIATEDKQILPYVVDPHCMGVYREDLNGLDRQEAIAQKYYITKSELTTMLSKHPERQKILAALDPKPLRPDDQMSEGLRRILISQQASAGSGPLTPGNSMTGNATLLLNDRISYTPEVQADVVEMVELWVRDDDRDGDYQTVTIAGNSTIIYDRENIFVKGEQPFVQVCPMPMDGYFWGRSFVGKLIGLQAWRNLRISQIQHMLALQAKPPTALSGWGGMVDETDFALDQPGGVLNSSDMMGKVERFAPKIPEDIWADLRELDEMFMECAGLSPILMGRGETGVRSGRQTSDLSRLGSSRTKKRAMCAEDDLETLATKLFKAMRKYQDTVYLTQAVDPGQKPTKFIMNQSPGDAIIKVDGHSNSPLFVEDQKSLSFDMLEAKMIDRESAIEMLNPPMKDMLLRKLPGLEKAEAAALKEKANFELQMAGAKHGAPNGAAPPTKQ